MDRRARRASVALAAAAVWLRLASAVALPGSTPPAVGAEPNPSPPLPAEQGDLTETIDADDPYGTAAGAPAVTAPVIEPIRAATAQAAPSVVPTADERMEIHGWARQSVELGLWRRASGTSDDNPVRLPYDQLSARSQLFVRARYSRGHWFEANVSGLLSYALFEQSPAAVANGFNGFNGQSTRSVVEPELHELFLGFYSTRFDLRIGQQRVAWGNTDFWSPNDVVNARDLRDPFLGEAEYRNLPTLLVRADLDLGFGTLQGLIGPAFVPDRFDVYGSNWAAVQPDAPVWARGLVNLAARSLDPDSAGARSALLHGYALSETRLQRTGARRSIFLEHGWSGR